MWWTLAAGTGSQLRLFEHLAALLTSAARVRALVLVVEDFHWADRSTRDFLSFLVRAARREPIALMISYRSDELQRHHPFRPFVLELERSDRATRFELGPFTSTELREQVTAILDQLATALAGRPSARALGRKPFLRRGAAGVIVRDE